MASNTNFKDANKFFCELQHNGMVDSDLSLASLIDNRDSDCYQNTNGAVRFGYRLYSPTSRIKLRIKDCCPREASQEVFFEIEHGFYEANKLAYYRYALVWEYDCMQSLKEDAREDYVSSALITLRRSIRFDYEPHIASKNHPAYHWHPNGCSEIKFATPEMDTVTVALFAYRAFNLSKFNALSETFKTKCELVEKMYSGCK